MSRAPARSQVAASASEAQSPGPTITAGHAGLALASARRPRPTAQDVEPVTNPTLDRTASAVVVVVPLLLVGLGAEQAWQGLLRWQDLLILAVCYLLTGLGVTVGYHRLFTHGSFRTSAPMRALLAMLGSAALEGPVIEWVATHRKHHRFSDRDGDPHSPHVDHGHGWSGALRGLLYAHVGWVLRDPVIANRRRYARDLLADPVLRLIDATFLVWALAGLALPFGLGVALSGSVAGGLRGLLWGGAVRIFFLHHATFSINSLCHFFGRQRFDTGDQSRNLRWLAIPTLGEAWHNNHHAFPTSARHGLGRLEIDPSAWAIALLEALGLAWDVVRISPERQRARLADLTASS